MDTDPTLPSPNASMKISQTTYIPRPMKALGVGSFGKVVECLQMCEGRWVHAAVKIFTNPNMDPIKVRREIGITLQAAHEKVVKVLHSGEFEPAGQKVPFIVLEKMQCNLRDFMKTNTGNCFPAATAALLFKDMLDAVEYLHQEDIYHRDIKPENFLLDFNNRIKISDFGEATFEPSCTTFTGTPEYMHPELFKVNEGTSSTYRAGDVDIYALGLTLYNISYDRSFLRLKRKNKDDMVFKATQYTKVPRSNTMPQEYWDLIDGMMQEKNRFTFKQIRENKWFVDSLQLAGDLVSSVCLDDIVESNANDPVMLTILRTLQKKYLNHFLSFSHEAVVNLIARLTWYYSSEADSLAGVSPLLANVLKYSKAMAVSKFLMMKVWTTNPRTEHEVQLDPVSLVFMMHPEVEENIKQLLNQVRADRTLDFKSAEFSQMETSYLKYMQEISQLKPEDPQYDACVHFWNLRPDSIEDKMLPAFKVMIQIMEVQLQEELISLCKIKDRLDPHSESRIEAYMSRAEHAAMTCAGIAKLTPEQIKALMTEDSPYDNPKIAAAFLISTANPTQFIDLYAGPDSN